MTTQNWSNSDSCQYKVSSACFSPPFTDRQPCTSSYKIVAQRLCDTQNRRVALHTSNLCYYWLMTNLSEQGIFTALGSRLLKKVAEAQIAGRLTEVGEDHGSFAAVLCAVVDDMHQTVPAHAFTHTVG